MKRMICFAAVLILVLSLCACGTSKQEKLAQELGISQDELEELQQALEEEAGGSGKEDAQAQQTEENGLAPYLGRWVLVNSEATIDILENGTYLYTAASDGYQMDGHVHLEDDGISLMTYNSYEQNGVTYLSSGGWNGRSAKYVRESEFDQVVETVTLTKDNFLDYFEFRITRNAELDDFGEVHYLGFTSGFFLKDEYVDRLAMGEATLRANYKFHEYAIANPKSPDFQFPGLEAAGKLENEQQADLHLDNAIGEDPLKETEFDETIGTARFVFFNYGSYVTEDPLPVSIIDEAEVVNAVGTLYLLGK